MLNVSIKNASTLPIPAWPEVMLEPLVRMALLEDLGRAGDVATATHSIVQAIAGFVGTCGYIQGGA